MSAHPHLELIEQFLEDARKTEHPEKLWRQRRSGEWCWQPCSGYPGYSPDYEYSHIPASINGHEYPLPETEPPAVGSTYYIPNLAHADCADTFTWRNDPFDQQMLRRGLVHFNYAAAAAHGSAIILAGGGEL